MHISYARKQLIFDQLGYKPHSPEQQHIHESMARFRIACCGRRWGKSIAAGHDMTPHLFIPETRWWICGPTYALAEKEFRVVHDDIVRKLKMQGTKGVRISNNVKQGDMRIEMPWGTVLEVKSAEKQDSLVGEGLDGVIMSEAALHKPSTWEMYIAPALADKKGWALFPSTPRGYNWFKGLYDLGQDIDMVDYESWRLPSWTNTIAFPGGREDKEIKRIEQVTSEYHFLQEYAAEFTAFEGKIYTDFSIPIHVRHFEFNPAWKNYWTFDFGFAAPFVCLDIGVDAMDNVYVWREYQVRHMSTWEHGNALLNRHNPSGFHVDGFFADPRGADEKATLELLLGGILARPVGQQLGYEAIRRWLKLGPDGEPKLFIHSRCTDLIRQMEQLRTPNEREGRNPNEGQHDYDDHGPDALRYFFNEYFILGAGAHLSDVYGKRYQGSEAQTFFQNHSHVKNNEKLIPFGY